MYHFESFVQYSTTIKKRKFESMVHHQPRELIRIRVISTQNQNSSTSGPTCCPSRRSWSPATAPLAANRAFGEPRGLAARRPAGPAPGRHRRRHPGPGPPIPPRTGAEPQPCPGCPDAERRRRPGHPLPRRGARPPPAPHRPSPGSCSGSVPKEAAGEFLALNQKIDELGREIPGAGGRAGAAPSSANGSASPWRASATPSSPPTPRAGSPS